MMSHSSILSLTNLEVGYTTPERISVLKDIDLNFKSGEMVCLMGPNGSGKSTLIRSISGLQAYYGGTIKIKNKPIEEFTKAEFAKQVSVVLTVIPFIGNLTVRQIVEMGRYPFSNWFNRLEKKDHEIVEKAIEVTNLETLSNKYFNTLSDGQKQKTLIARAISQDGEIIILDEPTSHLDLNNRVEIMNLLKDLAHSAGKCVIVSTHEMDLALQITDRLVLITSEGEIESGIPEDLVLSGKIDHTFDLKGYDLKRGKVTGRTFTQRVSLKGKDYPYLWTKNALERAGYEVGEKSQIKINIESEDHNFQNLGWTIEVDGKVDNVDSIQSMLNFLNTIFQKK